MAWSCAISPAATRPVRSIRTGEAERICNARDVDENNPLKVFANLLWPFDESNKLSLRQLPLLQSVFDARGNRQTYSNAKCIEKPLARYQPKRIQVGLMR